jgi:hypothetical protein
MTDSFDDNDIEEMDLDIIDMSEDIDLGTDDDFDADILNYDASGADYDAKKKRANAGSGPGLLARYAQAKQKAAAKGARLSRGIDIIKSFVLANRALVGHGCSPVDPAVLELRHSTVEEVMRALETVGQGSTDKTYSDAAYDSVLGTTLTLTDFQFGALLHINNAPFFNSGGRQRIIVTFDTVAGGVPRVRNIDVLLSPDRPKAIIAILAYANDGGKARVARSNGLTVNVPLGSSVLNDAVVTPGIKSTALVLESFNNFDLNKRGI